MDEFGSETGFVIHMPKTKKTIKKSQSKEYETESLRQKTNKMALEHFLEPLETALIRHRLYQDHWKEFCDKIITFENSCVSELVRQVVDFVSSNVEKAVPTATKFEVPVGFVVAGENKTLMGMIVEEIDAEVDDVVVARISSNVCINVKSAFQTIAKQLVSRNRNASRFVGETRLEDSLDEQEEEGPEGLHADKRYLSLYDINNWYKSADKVNSYVLIILDNADLCPTGVVGELLFLLNCLKFPFTVLFGLTSDFAPLTTYFPHDLAETCQVQKFSPGNPRESLDNFLEQALYDLETPFRLSGLIIQQLRDYFQNYHFSITRLLQVYQLCLLEHFRKPESIFCQKSIREFWESPEFSNLEKVVLQSGAHVAWFAEVKSPSKSPKKKGKVAVNQLEERKLETLGKLGKCQQEIRDWYESFLVLFQFGKKIPDGPLPNTKVDLYISVATGALFKDDETLERPISPFNRLVSLIETMSAPDLETQLEAAYSELQDFHTANACTKLVDLSLTTGIPYQVINFVSKLRKAVEDDKGAEGAAAKPITPEAQKPKRMRNVPVKDFNSTLVQLIRNSKPKLPEFGKARELIVVFFQKTIQSRLKNMADIPLAKIFIFDDVTYVRQQLFPNVPKELHVAMCLPQNYLNCDCCQDTVMDLIHESLPDTSILYKLLIEKHYLMVDLNDLYTAFKSYHVKETPKRRNSVTAKALQKAKEDEEDLIARFSQAFDELQLLGHLQPKKRKQDEAAKLCWIFG